MRIELTRNRVDDIMDFISRVRHIQLGLSSSLDKETVVVDIDEQSYVELKKLGLL